jgi:uncharacterized protein YndB with AHSA1/START domain
MGLEIGPLHVRRSVFVCAPVARVWAEFSTTERVKSWLDQGHSLHTLDLVVGGKAELSVEIDGTRRAYGGTVLAYEFERELSLSSQWQAPHDWAVPTFWTFRLTSLYDGTLVELFHHGFERLGADAADNLEGYETGWGMRHLSTLRQIVEAS